MTTVKFGIKIIKVYKNSAHILLYEQFTMLFFKETKWEIAVHLILGKKGWYKILTGK